MNQIIETTNVRETWVLMDTIAACIRGYRYRWATEKDLQDGIRSALGNVFAVEREARIDTDRIDFVVRRHAPDHLRAGSVGLEVKIDGSFSNVVRQLHRYAHSRKVEGLLLVTTCSRHAAVPSLLGGVPVRVALLGGLR